ncbi:hypothetical protein HIM_03935 [Hirsutella minnesotensis 3608]|uniref:Uncharacterized protein n=1 Tax=Hirsutella minnesotensis 3608 TaxID=1043627 RepID=A0A0F8A677_9HYPO|nr:hypothetical protein HIM_03935 [Hirsutella minnesotensis 3608]
MSVETSHGRGGAGNFSAGDDTEYVDGEIVRVGDGDGAHSAGRGGAGNITDAGTTPTPQRKEYDLVPAAATRPSHDGRGDQEQDFHTGRGGAGNEHHHQEETSPAPQDEAHGGSSAPAKSSGKGMVSRLKKKILDRLKK